MAKASERIEYLLSSQRIDYLISILSLIKNEPMTSQFGQRGKRNFRKNVKLITFDYIFSVSFNHNTNKNCAISILFLRILLSGAFIFSCIKIHVLVHWLLAPQYCWSDIWAYHGCNFRNVGLSRLLKTVTRMLFCFFFNSVVIVSHMCLDITRTFLGLFKPLSRVS